MTEPTDDREDDWPTAAERAGWDATLEELAALAEQRRTDGWTVVTVSAVETEPEPPGEDTAQSGLVYTVRDETADELTSLLAEAALDEFETYRRTVGGACYLVTELRDTHQQRCVLVAGAYDVAAAEPVAAHARKTGSIATRFHRLDGSVVAAVRHEAYEKLLPRSLRS